MAIAPDHRQRYIRFMVSLKETRNELLWNWRLGACRWVSVALLCATLAVAEQNKPDSSMSNMRASVTPPPTATPAPPPSLQTRGDIYMARKMYLDAIDMYQQSVRSASIENRIGIAFQQMSQTQLAKKHYEAAIKMDRNYAEAINNLGTVYYIDRSYGKAISYFKRSLKCSGPLATVYANLGSAYFGRRDYKNSSLFFEEALKLDPDVLEHHHGFGTRVQDSTVTDIALFHLYLAKTYAKAGKNDRAVNYLRKALEEGLKNRKKLADMPEFAALRSTREFLDLLAEDPKPL